MKVVPDYRLGRLVIIVSRYDLQNNVQKKTGCQIQLNTGQVLTVFLNFLCIRLNYTGHRPPGEPKNQKSMPKTNSTAGGPHEVLG